MRRLRIAVGGVALAAGLGLGVAALGEASAPGNRSLRPEAAPSTPAPDIAPGVADGSNVVAPPDEDAGAPPTDTAAPVSSGNISDDPAPAPEPLRRPRFDTAIFQAVDKITAETLRFEMRVGESVRYKGLVLTLHACEGAAADEAMGDSVANLDVVFQPQTIAGRASVAPRSVFRGWMFASSPSLHPLEQPSYDVWVIACRAASAPGARA